MSNVLHNALGNSALESHGIIWQTVANAAALAALVITATDVSQARVVKQTDTGQWWIPTTVGAGATFIQIASSYLGGQPVATATGAAPVLDFSVSRYYVLTLNANCSPTMVAPAAGVEAILEVVQGAGPFTLTLPANVDLQTAASGGGAPSISTVNAVRNIFKFLSNGTRLRLYGIGEY